MNFEFTSESDSQQLRAFAQTTRRLAREFFSEPAVEFVRDDFLRMAELGLAGLPLSVDVGGLAADQLSRAAVLFEISKERLGPGIYLSVHQMVAQAIERTATTDYLRSFLPALASGQQLAAFCLTESSAGSDIRSMKTTARIHKDAYLLDGEKVYITSAGFADCYLVFARDESAESQISAFVVQKQNEGISFGKHEKKMGCKDSPIASVQLSKCRVPLEARCGAGGDGLRIAGTALNGGRLSIAACACGIAANALARSGQHLKTRKQFGRSIADFQGLRFMYADMYSLFQASVLLTRSAAEKLDLSPDERLAPSIAKCVASDAAMKITSDAVQLLGGAGYLSDYRVEELMRDAKMLQIVEGTNQVQRAIIAKELLS